MMCVLRLFISSQIKGARFGQVIEAIRSHPEAYAILKSESVTISATAIPVVVALSRLPVVAEELAQRVRALGLKCVPGAGAAPAPDLGRGGR